MRFPWHHRAEKAKQERIDAGRRREEVEASWPQVYEARRNLAEQRRLNGWTGVAAALFADQKETS